MVPASEMQKHFQESGSVLMISNPYLVLQEEFPAYLDYIIT